MASKLPLTETVGMALNTLRANRLRSLLTMLGIVIGNASVITLVGVGRGAQNLAEDQLSNLGANVLFVVPGNNDTRRRGVAFPKTLVLEDAEAIAEQVPSVKRVAPQISTSAVVQAGSRSSSSSVNGVTPAFLPVRSFEVARGRFISEQDERAARSVVVIGPDLRDKLFPTGQAIGQNLRIKDQSFSVIGVMAPKGAVFGNNQDENAYIPLSTMVSRLTGRDATFGISLSFISVEAKNEASTGPAKFQITNLLRQRHRILRDDDFAVRSQKDALTIVGTITGGLTLMLAAIGGLSAGRWYWDHEHHVGLGQRANRRNRSAQSSRRPQLRRAQSISGGVPRAGHTWRDCRHCSWTRHGGSGCRPHPLPATIGGGVVLITVTLSGSIGLFFGVVPARRAAQLDPIVALRSL